MLESQLLQRKQQFEQCVDCHQQTLQQKPIAKVIMSYHQILCNICQNTSVHIVPIGDPINDDQPAKVYKKIFCKIHSKNVRKCKQCFIYLNEKGYSQCPKCNYSIFRCNMDKWKKQFIHIQNKTIPILYMLNLFILILLNLQKSITNVWAL
ncbi:hypothetical protein pb186bvf_004153 [Paramecium bursaria]